MIAGRCPTVTIKGLGFEDRKVQGLGHTCRSNNLQFRSKYPVISKYNPLNCKLRLQVGSRI